MQESYKIIERKTNTIIFSTQTTEEIYKHLIDILRARYLYKSPWIKLVRRCNLYNGYENIKCYSDNGYIYEFIISTH